MCYLRIVLRPPALWGFELMAKLTTAKRKSLPKSDFGLPASRGYPMEDKAHARAAKSRASGAVNAGRMSSGTEAKIDKKADRKLGAKKR